MGPLHLLICCLAVALGVAVAFPSAEIAARDARAQTVLDPSDPSSLRALGPVQTLAYYGGAKGQYLLIHPSGRRTVAHTPPPRKGNKPPKEDEDVGMAPDEESESEGDDEAVAINPPPENASVAEAKPVGLAIAGPGGVASSKPVGQAIVGPGGLAVARPIATAIAGVKGAGGGPGVAVAGGKGDEDDEEDARAKQTKLYFDQQNNRLHQAQLFNQRYLYPVNFY